MAQKISRRTLAKAMADQLIAGASTRHIAKSIAGYLIEQKMTKQLEMLLGDIAFELQSRNYHLLATVTSAHELNTTLQKEITNYLRAHYDVRHIELTHRTDPTLIGGVVIEAPDAELDMTVKAKLRRLQQA
jgi:F0F1-type ATP synthase delta subunit